MSNQAQNQNVKSNYDLAERTAKFGENTKEVWFVYNSFLYQISAGEGSGDALDKIMQTWRYQ